MSTEPSELVVVREQAPALAGFATASPALTLARGKAVADAAAPVIKELGMVKKIHQSFHVYFDGWTMVGAMVGVFPVTVRTWEIGQDEGYGANVEARSLSGEVVGAADAIVMRDEEVGGKRKWLEAPRFQVVSMAQTRAGGKALRQPLGWIMRLAGYEATPAEEMDEAAAARGETITGGKGVRPGWRDMAEQQRAHADLGELIDAHDLRKWVVEWCDSKSYVRPLAKGQFNQLKRAIEQELEDRATKTAGPGQPPGPGLAPTSEAEAHSGVATSASDPNASVTGPGDTGVSSGHEPPNTEAPTSPRPPTSPGGRGGRKSRSEEPAGASGGVVNPRDEGSSSDRDHPDEAEQAAFEQAQANDDAGKWTR